MTVLRLLYGAASLALLLSSARGNLADDSVLFSINWPGSSPDKKLAPAELETLWMVSAEKERYQCLLPAKPVSREDAEAATPYAGPTPLALLKPLFSRLFCSYRLEQYWTYELCHGKSVRQYHEESINNKVVLQEYFLGKYDAKKLEADDASYLSKRSQRPPRIRLEGGLELPYFAVNMTGGTACELGEQAQRTTRVLYVCSQEARNEVLSIDELSTCEYQAVVLTPYLCAHPDYSPETSPENPIQCVAQDGAPRQPRGLWTEQVQPLPPPEPLPLPPQPPPTADKLSQLVQDFLAGSHCLTGGAGWWKYEFCYGKRVSQFHEEKGKERISILLGTWDHKAHVTWLDKHPERKPGRTPRYLTHFYGSGDTCDLTGKPRTVEVLLKCRQAKGNLDSVSLYLLEPRTCEYILGVESALVCSFLDKVDEYALPS